MWYVCSAIYAMKRLLNIKNYDVDKIFKIILHTIGNISKALSLVNKLNLAASSAFFISVIAGITTGYPGLLSGLDQFLDAPAHLVATEKLESLKGVPILARVFLMSFAVVFLSVATYGLYDTISNRLINSLQEKEGVTTSIFLVIWLMGSYIVAFNLYLINIIVMLFYNVLCSIPAKLDIYGIKNEAFGPAYYRNPENIIELIIAIEVPFWKIIFIFLFFSLLGFATYFFIKQERK